MINIRLYFYAFWLLGYKLYIDFIVCKKAARLLLVIVCTACFNFNFTVRFSNKAAIQYITMRKIKLNAAVSNDYCVSNLSKVK